MDKLTERKRLREYHSHLKSSHDRVIFGIGLVLFIIGLSVGVSGYFYGENSKADVVAIGFLLGVIGAGITCVSGIGWIRSYRTIRAFYRRVGEMPPATDLGRRAFQQRVDELLTFAARKRQGVYAAKDAFEAELAAMAQDKGGDQLARAIAIENQILGLEVTKKRVEGEYYRLCDLFGSNHLPKPFAVRADFKEYLKPAELAEYPT